MEVCVRKREVTMHQLILLDAGVVVARRREGGGGCIWNGRGTAVVLI